MIQAHIYFSGLVQGVGFRYTTFQFAHKLKLCGWVKNLSDGRVESKVEGKKEIIEELISELKNYFQDQIDQCELTYNDLVENYKDFKIIH